MKIIHAEKHHFPALENFLKPHEEKCMFLASNVRQKSDKIWVITEDSKDMSNQLSTKNIAGVLYIDNSVFHCIPEPEKLDKEKMQPLLGAVFAKHKIKCINGEKSGTEFLTELIKADIGEPYQINHYSLMTCQSPAQSTEPLFNDDTIIRCTENDIDNLYDLQKGYLTEEVVPHCKPHCKKVTDAEVKIILRKILKTQFCLALISDGTAVAKANTNAIGWNCIQIGGVYTSPLFRRNGYAAKLIAKICQRAAKAGKKSVLFVRDINVSAFKLYESLNFKKSGFYEIAYFN